MPAHLRGLVQAVWDVRLGWAVVFLCAIYAAGRTTAAPEVVVVGDGKPPAESAPAVEPIGTGKGMAAGEIPPTPVPEGSKADGPQSTDDFTLKMTWADGLVGETADKAFRVHVGGRFDFDSTWYSAPANLQNTLDNPLLDGTDFRRFRFRVDGSAWQQLDFAVESDFSRAADFKDFKSTPQTNVFITDAWVNLHDLPVVDNVRVGHQKEYFTFFNGTSSNSEVFMEGPYIFDAFEDNFSFDSGVSTNRTYCDERATSWLGVFWNGTRSQAFNVGGRYAVSGRLTWLPIYDEEGQKWLNVGVSGSLRSASQNSDPTEVSVRPLVRAGQSFQVPDLIDSGLFLSRDGLQILGASANSAWGPFTLGGEFLCWSIHNAYTGALPNADGTLPTGAASVGDLFFSGFYVEALYFLTPGDHHTVDRVIPGYGRVRPVRNFLCRRDGAENVERGLGAWEIGLRYDYVDANSGSIQAGRLDSITAGLNWYWNPNARVMLNYVYTDLHQASAAASGSFNGLGLRFHLDF